jgi:DNA-directed RNA polymerase I subunit RPA43
MEYRGAKETNLDLMTDPGTPGTLQEVFSEDGHETKGMAEEETGYDDEGLMTDPGTPDTPQEEFRQDAQELDEIKDMNVDETEEEGGSDDEVLNLNSGSPQDDDFNPPGEIKDMNVDGPENDDLVVLGDGEGGEKSIDDSERFVAPFPITRVKRIIKLDKDVRLVTGDAIALIAQATALFVQNLSSASFTVMLRTKRKTIRGPDVVLAAKSTR